MSRIEQELELLRQFYPDLEYRGEGHWVLLPRYGVPSEGRWKQSEVAVAFQIPVGIPGQPPYGFYVRQPIEHQTGGAALNATPATELVPWTGPWLKFSWSPGAWAPTNEVGSGSNVLQFAISFADRLREGV